MCSFRSRRLKIIFVISAFLVATLGFGQYTEDLSKVRPIYGLEEDSSQTTSQKEEISTDSTQILLESLSQNSESDSVIDAMAGNPITQTNGFRIQVYSGDNRTKAEEIKKQLDQLSILEGFAKYKFFESGFIWRVKVGDFQTRLDAYRVYKKKKNDFPNCLLVPERKINLK